MFEILKFIFSIFVGVIVALIGTVDIVGFVNYTGVYASAFTMSVFVVIFLLTAFLVWTFIELLFW